MRATVDSFCLPKAGHTDLEYEDAVYVRTNQQAPFHIPSAIFAIADGATDSSFSKDWAETLVKSFGSQFRKFYENLDFVAELGRQFSERHRKDVTNSELPWYVEQKAAQGSFAAFLGVYVEETRYGRRIIAVSIGDCCLFHTRERHLVARFPIENPIEFTNRPFLIGSQDMSPDALRQHRRIHKANWHPGDKLFLMTDALAHWYLRCAESEPGTSDWLEDVQNQEDFASKIEYYRSGLVSGTVPELKNDDVTFVRCLLQ